MERNAWKSDRTLCPRRFQYNLILHVPKPRCFLDNPLSTLHNCLEPGHYLDNLLATLFQNSPLILVHVELLTEGFLSEILRKGTSFGKKSLILLVETIHQQIGKM